MIQTLTENPKPQRGDISLNLTAMPYSPLPVLSKADVMSTEGRHLNNCFCLGSVHLCVSSVNLCVTRNYTEVHGEDTEVHRVFLNVFFETHIFDAPRRHPYFNSALIFSTIFSASSKEMRFLP